MNIALSRSLHYLHRSEGRQVLIAAHSGHSGEEARAAPLMLSRLVHMTNLSVDAPGRTLLCGHLCGQRALERRGRRGSSHSEREEAFGFACPRVLSCAANALPCAVISQPSRRDELGLSKRRIHPRCSISSTVEAGTRC